MLNSSLKVTNIAPNHAIFENRVIDLVFLSTQTMGDEELELGILKIFNQTAGACLTIILGDIGDGDVASKKLKLQLHTLKGAALGVGAKSIVANILLAEEFFARNGFVEPEMLTNIGFATEEARRFIAKIISD